MPRYDHLMGRSDDMIIFRGVNVYPGQIAAVLNEFPECGAEYHITLTRDEGRDAMALQVERNENAQNGADEALAAKITKQLHSQVLISASVEITDPMTLPRSFSKSRRVTDKRV